MTILSRLIEKSMSQTYSFSHTIGRNAPMRAIALPTTTSALRSFSSDSITYSGGQAQKGQGGFYGSGGARVMTEEEVNEHTKQGDDRKTMLALAQDVEHIRNIMEELETLERLLEGEESVSNKSMEIKSNIKKLMSNPSVLESLNNLEINGEPVWGLSCSEREMIILAREKVKEC